MRCRFLPRAAFRGLQWLQRPAGNPYLDHPLLQPVKREVFTNELEVDGEVPGDLDGVYIRTGPNPPHRPWGDHHWCAPCATLMQHRGRHNVPAQQLLGALKNIDSNTLPPSLICLSMA